MKYQVELINCLAYYDKKTNLPKTCLSYRMFDTKLRQNSDKLKGFSNLTHFADGHELFNKMKPEYFGVNAEIETEEQPSLSNPMRRIVVLKSVKIGNEYISLL